MPLKRVDPVDLPAVLLVERWADPLIEEHGHALDSEYVETFWLSTLGPTALWLARRLAQTAQRGPSEARTGLLAAELGVDGALHKNGVMARTVARLRMFGVAELHGQTLRVRTHLAPLNRRQAKHLPPHLAALLEATV